MRNLWTKCLALSLGLLVTGAHAEETVWRAKAVQPQAEQPPAATDKPIAIAVSHPSVSRASTPARVEQQPATVTPKPAPSPAASLGRPVPIATSRSDSQVRPVEYSTLDPLAPVIRGQVPETIPHKPMPVGPSDGSSAQFGWRRPDQPVATSPPGSPVSAPIANIGPPLSGPVPGVPVVSGPVVGGPVGGVPLVGAPVGASLFASGCGCATCGMGDGGACCAGGCNNCCNFNNRFWVGAEYLLWWMKGDRTPPLVSAGDPLANPTKASVLGTPTSSMLFGGHELGTNAFSGVRISGGYWFNDEHSLGLDVNAFLLGPQNTRFSASSTGIPALGRPIIDEGPRAPVLVSMSPRVLLANASGGLATMPNPNFGVEAAQQVAFPGVVAGSVSVQRKSSLWGGDANLRSNIWCSGNCYLDAFVGFRIVGLDESLSITESLVTLSDTSLQLPNNGGRVVLIPSGTSFLVSDSFSTSNRFYGAQAGLAGEYRLGQFSVGGRVALALGDTQETVNITGFTRATTPTGQVQSAAGGLLAQPGTNIGHYSRDTFGVIPEVGFTLGYYITPGLRAFVGYNLLYWNSVVRPDEQIDRHVNTTFVPGSPIAPTGAAVPHFPFSSSDYWAQGITVGFEYKW